MSLPETLFLSIIQGITEFLPISSSGHLVLFQKIIGFKDPPVFFDILVHVGTLTAVIIFFQKKIKRIIKETLSGKLNYLKILIIASIPAAIAGFLLETKIELIFNSLFLLGLSFLLNSVILFSTKTLKTEKGQTPSLNSQKSFFIGLFQALAILPGISRSGSTITAGLKTGLTNKEAFDFSFLLAIPAILGALLLKIPDIFKNNSTNSSLNILGFITALIIGYLSLKLLEKFVKKGNLFIFAPYTLILGVLSITLSFFLK